MESQRSVAWMKAHYGDLGEHLPRSRARGGRWKRHECAGGENGVTLYRWKLGEVTLEINVLPVLHSEKNPSDSWTALLIPPPASWGRAAPRRNVHSSALRIFFFFILRDKRLPRCSSYLWIIIAREICDVDVSFYAARRIKRRDLQRCSIDLMMSSSPHQGGDAHRVDDASANVKGFHLNSPRNRGSLDKWRVQPRTGDLLSRNCPVDLNLRKHRENWRRLAGGIPHRWQSCARAHT